MNVEELRARLGFDDRELARRRAIFELEDDDLARLLSLRPLAERWMAEIVDEFYGLLLRHPGTHRFLTDAALVRRLKQTQSVYLLELFDGRCDLAYVENRLRVGAAHERIGLEPKWYIAAYRNYLSLFHVRLEREISDQDEARRAFQSVCKLVCFDMSIAIDTYISANLDSVGRHRAAIRELSTPVIRVHEGLLLLPLVGTVDSLRAQQVTEMVLRRIVEEKARAIIIDIAGAPVVDTKVADHLLQTTAAVKMLGAETILTGINAHLARTIVRLGVDISAMHTCARLADGIELGLALLGKHIVADHDPARVPHQTPRS